MRTHRIVAVSLCLFAGAPLSAFAQGAGNQPPALLSDLVDVSRDFRDYTNAYYVADTLAGFDPATGTGRVKYRRNQVVPRLAFNNMEQGLRPFEGAVFPAIEYPVDPELAFSVQFVSPRAVRLRFRTGPEVRPDGEELMLAGEPGRDASWKYEKVAG